ncbi:hypothetical protein AAC387_Pa03g4448 [Persea americana]
MSRLPSAEVSTRASKKTDEPLNFHDPPAIFHSWKKTTLLQPVEEVGGAAIRVEDYSHSLAPVAVALGEHTRLSRLLSSLPRLAYPSQIKTESDSLLQKRLAEPTPKITQHHRTHSHNPSV